MPYEYTIGYNLSDIFPKTDFRQTTENWHLCNMSVNFINIAPIILEQSYGNNVQKILFEEPILCFKTKNKRMNSICIEM